MSRDNTHSHQAEIDHLYELLQRRMDVLRDQFGHLPTPRDLPTKRDGWRTKGVYFFFEQGETRSRSQDLRVVRIGSHSGQTSSIESRIVGEHAKNWGRSVFRRDVGSALLRKGEFDMEIDAADRERWVEEWNRRIKAKRGTFGAHHRPNDLRPILHALHPIATHTITTMNIVWVEIPDRQQRLELEEQCIMLLSNSLRPEAPIDPPSDQWLGRCASKEEVRTSGLWNVKHTKKPYTPGFLDDYEKYFR